MSFNIRLVSIIAGSILTVTFILYVVSNAVQIWSKTDSGSIEITYGLWRYCYSFQGTNTCYDLKCTSDHYGPLFCTKLAGSRVFVTVACIASGMAAIFLYSFAVTGDNTSRLSLLATKFLVFACLIAGILGVAVVANTTQSLGQGGVNLNLGVAAIIGIVAIIVNLGGGIVALFIQR